MTNLSHVILVFLLGAFVSSCSGRGGDVAVVVATAATLQAVQTVREHRTPPAISTASKGDCCAVCAECTFPCGDVCVANGSLCTRPKGCACTADEAVPPGTPRPEPNPVNCNANSYYIEL